MAPLCYRRHRFPPDIVQHAIWLYLRFTLSYRDVEELLVAAWPGWTLDAFDFTAFLLIIAPIAKEFDAPVPEVAAVSTSAGSHAAAKSGISNPNF